MNKQEFLEKEVVKDFIDWIIPRISGEIRFSHLYYNSKKNTPWSCNSIYNAYKNYTWGGKTYDENEIILEEIKQKSRSALNNKDVENTIKYSISILEWGE
ncbi:MAG: hypothetical protein GDA37_01575 [Ekhidna sp.]|nr:hypothetical protein [Ekhidna sp.]